MRTLVYVGSWRYVCQNDPEEIRNRDPMAPLGDVLEWCRATFGHTADIPAPPGFWNYADRNIWHIGHIYPTPILLARRRTPRPLKRRQKPPKAPRHTRKGRRRGQCFATSTIPKRKTNERAREKIPRPEPGGKGEPRFRRAEQSFRRCAREGGAIRPKHVAICRQAATDNRCSWRPPPMPGV